MSSKNNCKENVLKYMINQNRPYSANDIAQNLHNEFSRAALQKALDELVNENKIREKVYGKQKVYSCVQPDDGASSSVSCKLNELDFKTEEARMKLHTLEAEFKLANDELKKLENQLTAEVALKQISELEEDVKRLEGEIESLSKLEVKVNETQESELTNKHEKLSKEHRKRKAMCMDIVHTILENYPKNIGFLLDEIGIEGDTDGVARS
ncbi:hypothetical protein RUM43_013269 [Polyplax serrata]|uniref:Homologous-pairing protein 2 winged helix domain-containing protein n=1 Tax=Polyplax serrata TaxID=468196 RepID=A0AAN8S3R6_POLSC